jgi:hypothetical protein
MDWVEISLVVIGAAALVVELVAVIGRRLGKRWPTISKVLRVDGREWLIWPYGWGLLGGHLFHSLWWEDWPWLGRVLPPHQPWMSWALAGNITAVVARDLWARRHPAPVSKRVLALVYLAGALEGAILWAQG